MGYKHDELECSIPTRQALRLLVMLRSLLSRFPRNLSDDIIKPPYVFGDVVGYDRKYTLYIILLYSCRGNQVIVLKDV